MIREPTNGPDLAAEILDQMFTFSTNLTTDLTNRGVGPAGCCGETSPETS